MAWRVTFLSEHILVLCMQRELYYYIAISKCSSLCVWPLFEYSQRESKDGVSPQDLILVVIFLNIALKMLCCESSNILLYSMELKSHSGH